MADSSFEKGLTEYSRMKVADLKAELKKKNLSTAGNKQELIERLQSYINGGKIMPTGFEYNVSLSLDETNEEILDEDAVLGDEELEELASKSDSQEIGVKRKLPSENSTSNSKKVILNRNPIIEEIKVTTPPIIEEKNGKEQESVPTERKIIKLSELSSKERLEMRAKKFGMPVTEAAKKEARSARFNLNNTNSSAASIKTPVATSYEVLKKRAERFGATVSSVLEKADQQDRIEKRKARFGEVKPGEKVFQNKIKIVK